MSRSWLIVSSAIGEQRVDLPVPGQVRVGRGVRNDLILNDDALSREDHRYHHWFLVIQRFFHDPSTNLYENGTMEFF